MNAGQIREILEQYAKHGWILRRVLLSAATRENLADALELLFGDAPLYFFKIDAVWFSRSAANGNEAWELRRLSSTPFALVKVFNDDDNDETREEMRRETEKQMENAKR